MVVRVQLFAYLARYSPTKKEKFTLELKPDATVGLLLTELRFPTDIEKMVLVNGRQANPATQLAEGDDIFIFPPAAGG